ncbi:hypothetical protein XO12_06575 [Marinitoga sp. 1154]|nr:hypothetical protein [Marinitoga sp. 1154]
MKLKKMKKEYQLEKVIVVADRGMMNRDNIKAVEKTFRTLKNYLETRPIFHWTPKRIKGHIVMSFISYIILRTLELELEKNNIEYYHDKIRDALKNMEYSEIRIKDKKFELRVNLSEFQKNRLKTLKIEIQKKNDGFKRV